MRAAYGEVFLPLAEFQPAAAYGSRDVCVFAALPSEPVPAYEWGTDCGAGARQGNFRTRVVQERQTDSATEPVWDLPQRSEIHQPEKFRCGHGKVDGSLPAGRCAAALERGVFRALPA